MRGENGSLGVQLDTLNHECGVLRSQLQLSEIEHTRLLAAQTWLQQLLDERASQLRSLEDKHQHARDGLAHFRESSRVQREQDLRRHDAQIQHLQTEIRDLQQSLSTKLEELTTLNRDNERLLAETGAQAKQQRLLEQELLKQRTTIQALRQDLINRQTERAALEERLEQKQGEITQLQQQNELHRTQLFQLQHRLTGAPVAAKSEQQQS
ncbi:hypothetical protein FQZ97_909810 [compost metagenome]